MKKLKGLGNRVTSFEKELAHAVRDAIARNEEARIKVFAFLTSYPGAESQDSGGTDMKKRRGSAITHNPESGWFYRGHMLDMLIDDSGSIRCMALRWRGILGFIDELEAPTDDEKKIAAFARAFITHLESAELALDGITEAAADEDDRVSREVSGD